MLSQLVAAVEENQRNSKRAFWSGIGYALSTLSVLVAGFAFAVYPEWFLPHHHRTQVKHAHSNKPHYTHIAPEPLLYARKFDGKS
jgi:hypothetical protein